MKKNTENWHTINLVFFTEIFFLQKENI